MCLINEKPVDIPSVIGYCVLEKIDESSYIGLYYGSVFYSKNITDMAIAEESRCGNFYLGFHGFFDLIEAKRFMEIIIPRSTFAIVKCLFEEVLATGMQQVVDLEIPAFRAKYRTILEEVGENENE